MQDKITLAELQGIFEDGLLPMEAFELLAYPGTATPDEVRGKLREIRAAQDPRYIAKRALSGKLWSWIEEHDMKHSEACQIAAEVVAQFNSKD